MTKILQITISPVLFMAHDKKEHMGTVVLIEDITEDKNLQRTRDEFFTIASHELRTPLTAIRGNTSMIMEYFGDQLNDANLREMISDIYSSSLRLIELVNDFLDTSRLELGKIEFKKQEVPIIDLVESVVKELQANANEKHLSLSVNHSGYNSLYVIGDADKLKQVIFNLVGNAIKFTSEGFVTVHFSDNAGKVFVHIADSGKGIPKETQHLLFRKFQQAGESLYTRDAMKGTGMGLYISRLVIDRMGGSIQLEQSEVNKGSTFCFSLPFMSKS